VLILLPPSEGKTAPSEGAPVDVDTLPFPTLNKTRERLLDVLSRLTFPRALKYLDIGPGLLEEAQRNLTSPCARRPSRRRTRCTPACSTSTSASARSRTPSAC
jgi:hypothetical protein